MKLGVGPRHKIFLFCFPSNNRSLRDSVGHWDVGTSRTGLPPEQSWHHSVRRGLQCPTEVGDVWRENKFSGPEASTEGWRGDAVWGATLSRLQWDEPLQFPHLFKVQKLPGGLISQVTSQCSNFSEILNLSRAGCILHFCKRAEKLECGSRCRLELALMTAMVCVKVVVNSWWEAKNKGRWLVPQSYACLLRLNGAYS